MMVSSDASPSSTLAPGSRPLALLALAGTTILAGAAIGGLTNAINGAVSPTYFINVMHWQNVADVWRASVAQGIFEGLIFGLLYAAVFTAAIGLITRATCPYFLALRYLVLILLAALGCWVLGGLVAMGLATLSPEFFRENFIGVPSETAALLRYAWVGGSIWGVQFGGLLALIVGLVLFRARWKFRPAGPDSPAPSMA